MKKIIAISIALVGILLIVFSSFGMTQELSDSDVVDAMLPPCTVEDGLPIVGDDDVTCYWGMSVEVLEIPKEAVAANVDVEITWEKSGVWIGIAKASEASKCELKDDYYECPKDSITMIAGGPDSDGEIIWQPEPGEYRFVAGGEDSQTLQKFDVSWNYQASLNSNLAIGLIIVGAVMTIAGVGLWYKIRT